MHLRYHLRTIKQAFTPKGNGSPSNRYYSLNNKGLTVALDSLADTYVTGGNVTITDVENAINAYAAEHPTSIRIGSLSGYQEVYLTGPWPDTIPPNAHASDSTVIIIVAENGTTTTVNADGSVTTSNSNSSNSDSSNTDSQTGGEESNNDSGSGGESGNDSTEGGNSVTGGNTEQPEDNSQSGSGDNNQTGEGGEGDNNGWTPTSGNDDIVG